MVAAGESPLFYAKASVPCGLRSDTTGETDTKCAIWWLVSPGTKCGVWWLVPAMEAGG